MWGHKECEGLRNTCSGTCQEETKDSSPQYNTEIKNSLNTEEDTQQADICMKHEHTDILVKVHNK